MSILKALKDEIVKTKEFTLVPSKGEIRKLKLLEGGAVEDEDSIIVRWDVTFGGMSKNVPMLTLYLESGLLLAALMLDRTKWHFVGRERESTGSCTVSPAQPLLQNFKRYADPKAFYSENEGSMQKFDAHAAAVKNFMFVEQQPPEFDWSKHEYDLSKLVDKSKLVQSNTAVALIACDRTDYFKRTVESIAANPPIATMPVFLFLDKSTRDFKVEEMEKQAQVARKCIPHVVVISRHVNYGCGRNIIDARVQLFDNMGYDQMFVFEDDMVVTPDYVRLCLNLMAWANDTYSNVGAVQAWNKCIMSRDTKLSRLDEVHATYTNWWGYLLKKSAWAQMREYVLKYQDLFLRGEYGARPHKTIIEFFRALMRIGSQSLVSNKYKLDEDSWNAHQRYFAAPPTGQDAITMHTLEMFGMVRLATTVNRGQYIGKEGVHMSPGMYERDGFQHMELERYPDDSNRLEFRERSGAPKPQTPLLEVSHL